MELAERDTSLVYQLLRVSFLKANRLPSLLHFMIHAKRKFPVNALYREGHHMHGVTLAKREAGGLGLWKWSRGTEGPSCWAMKS